MHIFICFAAEGFTNIFDLISLLANEFFLFSLDWVTRLINCDPQGRRVVDALVNVLHTRDSKLLDLETTYGLTVLSVIPRRIRIQNHAVSVSSSKKFFFRPEYNWIPRAGGRLAKAEGRRPDASAGRPCRSPVRVGGLGGREGATHQQKRIFCYEMYFKHDLPHDVG